MFPSRPAGGPPHFSPPACGRGRGRVFRRNRTSPGFRPRSSRPPPGLPRKRGRRSVPPAIDRLEARPPAGGGRGKGGRIVQSRLGSRRAAPFSPLPLAGGVGGGPFGATGLCQTAASRPPPGLPRKRGRRSVPPAIDRLEARPPAGGGRDKGSRIAQSRFGDRRIPPSSPLPLAGGVGGGPFGATSLCRVSTGAAAGPHPASPAIVACPTEKGRPSRSAERGEKGGTPAGAGGGASGRSIAGGLILLPRLRGRPGRGPLPRWRKRRARARQSPVAPGGPPPPPPASGRGGKGRHGLPGLAAAVPVIRLPAARSSSPACGGGRVGVRCRAGGNGVPGPGKAASRREALPRPLPQAGGEERGGTPAGAGGGGSGRSIAGGTLLLPRLRGRPGGGPLPRWRKRRARARQSRVAPGGPPPTPPASGRGGKGRHSCRGWRRRFRSFDCRRPDPPPPLAGEAG